MIDYDPILIKLLSCLLKRNPRLSVKTINNLESGVGLFLNKFIETFPVDLCNLFELFTAIIKGAPQCLNKVRFLHINPLDQSFLTDGPWYVQTKKVKNLLIRHIFNLVYL